MITNRRCDVCGAPYEAKRAASKYCGDVCRKRATRGAPLAVLEVDADPAVEMAPGTVAAVRGELDAVEQSASALGAMALALAARIDSGRETGSAMATLTRELRLTMDEARASGRNPASIAEKLGDQLAQRRASRGG